MKLGSTALLRIGAMPFVGEKALQRDQQKRAKSAFIRRNSRQRFAFEQTSEESLSQVFRIVRGVALAADVSIERIPVCLAKRGKRITSARRFAAARVENDAPMSRRKIVSRSGCLARGHGQPVRKRQIGEAGKAGEWAAFALFSCNNDEAAGALPVTGRSSNKKTVRPATMQSWCFNLVVWVRFPSTQVPFWESKSWME